jgi:hypothetical protein
MGNGVTALIKDQNAWNKLFPVLEKTGVPVMFGAGSIIAGPPGAPANAGTTGEIQTKALEAVTEHPGEPLTELAEYAGIPRAKLQAALTRMQASGLVKTKGRRPRVYFPVAEKTAET